MILDKKIIFRCDASPLIGSGHVMRCLTIANDLRARGFHCIFWTSDETPATVPFLLQSGYQIISTQSKPSVPHKAVALFVDHYGLDATAETAYRSFAARIIAIDDLANRPHDCDVLIDSTLDRQPDEYKGLVPADCIILTGSNYAPLRPAFLQKRPNALAHRDDQQGKIERILVSLGSTDPHNITKRVMLGLQDSGLVVDVVIGSGCPHIEDIQETARILKASSFTVNLHMNVPHIDKLMLEADLAIGAGGTTSWERCALGLPTLLIEIADNQKDNAAVLEKHGAVINLGWHDDVTPEIIAKNVTALSQDPARMMMMSQNAFKICDGRGAARIAPYSIAPENGVTLRLMNIEDSQALYHWQCQPGARTFSRNSAIPNMVEHNQWFLATLNNVDRFLYSIMKDNKAVGMLRLDRYKDKRNHFEISILLDNAYHGQGIAASTLAYVRKLEPSAVFMAEVLPGNDASERLFLKSGFSKVGETLFEHKGTDYDRANF